MTVPDVYHALWRHKLAILVLTTSLGIASAYLTTRQEPVYRATTLIRIQQNVDDPSAALGALQTGQRLAQTYARITTTQTVARKIYNMVNAQIPYSEIRLSASQVEDLELLSISAESSSPETAHLVAAVAPRALKEFIRETETLRDQIVVVDEPLLPRAPSGPSMKRNVAVAILLGLILNGSLALLLVMFSDRVRDPEEFERITGKPLLTTVPTLEFRPPERYPVPDEHGGVASVRRQ